MIGQELADSTHPALSLTTESKSSKGESLSHVWLFLIISTEMASSGTTLPVTTRNL